MLGLKKRISLIVAICLIVNMFAGIPFAASAADPTPIEIIVGYASDDNASGLTTDLLKGAGVTASLVIDTNLNAYKTEVAAARASDVDTAAEIENLVKRVNLAEAIKKIEAYNVANDASAMTIDELKAANVTGTLDVNLPEYKTAIADAATGAANETSKIQGIINGVNSTEATKAIAAIEAYGAGAAGLTINQLIKAGVTGTVAGNLDTAEYGYKVKIGAAADNAADTLAEIQALINASNAKADEVAAAAKEAARVAAVNAIIGYASDDDASSLTIGQIKDAGVTGIEDAVLTTNLTLYKKAIEIAAAADVDTTAEIIALIKVITENEATRKANIAAAIELIKKYAANDDASELTIATLAAAGVTGAIQANLDTKDTGYKDVIASKTSAQVDTTAEIQEIIDTINGNALAAAITKIQGFATANKADDMTISDLEAAGVVTVAKDGNTPAISINLLAYKLAIAAADATGVGTTSKIQAIVNKVNKALVDIEKYNTDNNAGALTEQQLIDAGVTGTITANLDAYKKAIADAAAGGADTTAELQAIVDSVNFSEALSASIKKIEDFNKANNASTMSIDDLKAAGVVRLVDSYLTIADVNYRSAIAGVKDGEADTTAEIQAIIDSVNAVQAAVLVIKDYAANDDAGSLTIAQLKAGAITATVDANLSAYKTAIEKATGSAADTVSEIQGIINTVNTAQIDAAVAAIEAYGSGAAGLTIDQLKAAAVTGVIDANLAAYKVAIGAAVDLAANTTAKIQTIVDTVNANEEAATLAIIALMAANDDASKLTIAQLGAAGITGALDRNLSAYKLAISIAVYGDVDTKDELQTLVNNVNTTQRDAMVLVIKGYATNKNASALTIDQLVAAGVTTETAKSANLAAYKVAVAGSVDTAVDTFAEIQTLVDNVNTAEAIKAAVGVIMSYAENDNAGALTIAQLTAAGVTGTEAYLEAYKAAIAASSASDVDTTAKIKAVIDNAKAKADAIKDIENNVDVTLAKIITAGVTGTIAANENAYKTAIATATDGAADTTVEIQAIINTVNINVKNGKIAMIALMAANDDASSLTIDILVAAGITGANPVNLGTHKTDADHPSTGYIKVIEDATASQTDTTAEIQALIDALNAQKAAANITSISVGTVGTIGIGTSDPAFPTVIVVKVPTTITTILKTNFTVSSGATFEVFTNSNFTGLVENAALSGNSTALYVKVVSENATVTKYFKVVFDTEDTNAKYTLTKTQDFAAAGSNFVAKVSINRGNAVALSDAKLYAIYTLANGSQILQTLELGSATAKDIVVSEGFVKVQLVLVNGNVDWSKGFDSIEFKSNSITLTLPKA